jgi:hypothetical protein
MPGSIFILHDDGTLVEMKETPYDSEALLQGLLADYSNLLAGDQIDPDNPRRWLLVTREMRVSGDESTDRGYLDHLFLDQDAVPTLVEVKRSENTQIRREVVGQMLDYAANGVAFWSVDDIRVRYEETCRRQGFDPDEKLRECLGPEAPGEDYWQRVKTNLQAGRIRLIFVADKIPPGLRRIVEFLNGQMELTEVLAIEVRQHVGQGLKALAPAVIGQTAAAQRAKSAGAKPSRKWDENSFFAELQAKHPDAVPVARRILEWAKINVRNIWWGEGMQAGSFIPIFRQNGIDHQLFAVYTYGRLETFFQHYQRKPPFDSEPLRVEKLNRLNAIPGITLAPESVSKRPSIALEALGEGGRIESLLGVYAWVLDQIQNA